MNKKKQKRPDTNFRGASNPQEIFEVLNRHNVDYTVIGGIAVQAHGSTRTTMDVDFVASSDRQNLQRLTEALKELDAELWGLDAHLLGIDIFNPSILANGGNFTLVTRAGGLDFFNEVPGGVPYTDLKTRSSEATVRGIKFRVASVEDLIRMKEAAGRPRDLQDIAALTDPLAEDNS